MSFENDGNSFAVEHLINLEKKFDNKRTDMYKTLLDAIGEAGGERAVEHLINLEKKFDNKRTDMYKHLVSAIGRAGRIS